MIARGLFPRAMDIRRVALTAQPGRPLAFGSQRLISSMVRYMVTIFSAGLTT